MNLEFFIKLREMVSSGLVKMADTARKTTSAIKGTNDTLSQSYDTIKRKIGELESVIGRSTSIKQIREARRELEQLQRIAGRSPGNLAASGSGGGGFIRQLLPAMSIAGAMALGGGALTDGLQAQARSVSFEVMAGKTDGQQLNKDLTKFAQDSIFGGEVYQNAQTMLAFGASVKEVMPDLKMLGDISMGDKDKLGRLTLAFSQVRAAGKLMGQDLLQFVNAGFNPLQIISEKTGRSLGDLRKEVEEGNISFAMVKEAFNSATSEGGRFYDMTNKIAQTDFGKWEAFKGQLSGLSMQVGGVLAPILGNLVTNILAPLVTLVSNNIEVFTFLTTVLATGAAAYYAYAAGVWAVGAAKTAALVIGNLWLLLTGQLTISQWALNAAMTANPIGIVIAAIAALVAGIVYAWKNFEGFRGVVLGLWEVFKTVFTNIGNFFQRIFSPIAEAIQAFKEGRILDVGKAVGKLAFNISPIGLVANAAAFAAEGGFTKGASDAWKRGQELAKNNTAKSAEKSSSVSTADAKPATVSGVFDSIKSKGGSGDEAVKGITGSGPRVIHIHGVKFTDKIDIHTTTLREGADEIKNIFDEYMLRILNSGASVQ